MAVQNTMRVETASALMALCTEYGVEILWLRCGESYSSAIFGGDFCLDPGGLCEMLNTPFVAFIGPKFGEAAVRRRLGPFPAALELPSRRWRC